MLHWNHPCQLRPKETSQPTSRVQHRPMTCFGVFGRGARTMPTVGCPSTNDSTDCAFCNSAAWPFTFSRFCFGTNFLHLFWLDCASYDPLLYVERDFRAQGVRRENQWTGGVSLKGYSSVDGRNAKYLATIKYNQALRSWIARHSGACSL